MSDWDLVKSVGNFWGSRKTVGVLEENGGAVGDCGELWESVVREELCEMARVCLRPV